jgi:hypothetical protein
LAYPHESFLENASYHETSQNEDDEEEEEGQNYE